MSREEREAKCEEGCQFRTPAKHPTTTVASSSYCASSLEEIASRIKSNAEKRFRLKQNSDEYFPVFWSDLKQVSESSKPKEGALSELELDARIRRERLRLSKAESLRGERYERVKSLLLVLQGAKKEQARLQGRLRSLRAARSKVCALIQYERFLRTNQSVLCESTIKLQAQIVQRQLALASLSSSPSQLPVLQARKAEQLARLAALQSSLCSHERRLQQLLAELHPTAEAMVHCLFLIGVLKEQIGVAGMLRQERREKAVGRSFRLGQRMARREVAVDSSNSLIAELLAAVAVYMHCRSLTIGNLSSLMNTLSFFSEEFKEIYSYPTFRRYVSSHLFGSSESLAEEIAATDPLKKKLVIRTEHQHLPLLKTVLRPFQVGPDCFCVYLQPYCMLLQARPETPQLAGSEDCPLENNQLKVSFAE